MEEKEDDYGRLLERVWKDPDRLRPHRIKGPAVERFDPETGELISETWMDYREGGRHRSGDLPASWSKDPKTGVITFEEYWVRGYAHRGDGKPAEIYRDAETGSVIGHVFCLGGQRHRDGELPAVIDFDPVTGNVTREEYLREGRYHRENGPAIVCYDESGNAIPETMEFHRVDDAPEPGAGSSPEP